MDETVYKLAFGRALRDLRQQAGFSQEQMAAASGIRRAYISEMEQGEHDPRLSTLFRLAELFRMPVAGLVAEIERNYQLLGGHQGTHIEDIDVVEGILVVNLSGTAECAACLQTWRQVVNVAAEKGVTGILMNALAVDGSVDTRDHNLIESVVPSYLAERQLDIKRALVGRPPTVIRTGGTGRESKAEVFSTVGEALRWLKS